MAPAQEIYEAIRETSKVKSVVASLASMAASGGYYVASAADRVFANPGTITGSIGVVMRHSNIDELYRKIGLSTSVIKSGEYKDLGSSFRNITPREERLFQGLLDTVHGQFIDAVAAGRGMEREKVAGLAEDGIAREYAQQNVGMARIAAAKFDAINTAVFWLRLALFSAYTAALVYAVCTITTSGT